MPTPPGGGLTEWQEQFCRHYIALRNGAAAVRASYPNSRRQSSDKQSERARALLRNPRIQARIAELGGLLEEPETPTVEQLEQLAMQAFDANQPELVRLVALRLLDRAFASFPLPNGSRILVRVRLGSAKARVRQHQRRRRAPGRPGGHRPKPTALNLNEGAAEMEAAVGNPER
jgi:hypothetical protein